MVKRRDFLVGWPALAGFVQALRRRKGFRHAFGTRQLPQMRVGVCPDWRSLTLTSTMGMA